jgi:hypothetical protein
MKRGKACTMAKVKYITSANEIPAEQKFLLVMYGQGYAQTRHDFGLTITVARQQSKTVSELSFWTTVHTAKGIAKQEGISEIFVCTAATPWATPTIPHPPAGRTSPGVSMTTPRATAARITVRRNYATPSALVIWPGSPQPTHVVGMKTKR